MPNGYLISIQVGKPQQFVQEAPVDSRVALWRTGIYKTQVIGSRWLGLTNIEGDGQADLYNHGGPDKAVNVYPAEHYSYWQHRYHCSEMTFGGFGENFTIEGLTESNVRIGDVFRIGEALVQVSQPRQPCWKLSRRWSIKEFASQVEVTGYTGWYFRVLQEGHIAAGMAVEWVRSLEPTMTVSEANEIMHHLPRDFQAAETLLRCPALSKSWKDVLAKRLASQNRTAG